MATNGVKLLFDENISHRLTEFIARESRLAEMQHIRKMGWSGKRDIDWIPLAVQKGFVIITGDRNEATRGYTTADLKQMNARVILMGSFWDHLSRWERAKWLVNHIDALVALAGSLQAGTALLLNKRGTGRQL